MSGLADGNLSQGARRYQPLIQETGTYTKTGLPRWRQPLPYLLLYLGRLLLLALFTLFQFLLLGFFQIFLLTFFKILLFALLLITFLLLGLCHYILHFLTVTVVLRYNP